ncbi:hypothetical protein DFH09DRAFT_1084851 [Mycena vulgaris]|nr:hypothetical protein DFH09DRAFT_1084851 [Mycena vulgaris]
MSGSDGSFNSFLPETCMSLKALAIVTTIRLGERLLDPIELHTCGGRGCHDRMEFFGRIELVFDEVGALWDHNVNVARDTSMRHCTGAKDFLDGSLVQSKGRGQGHGDYIQRPCISQGWKLGVRELRRRSVWTAAMRMKVNKGEKRWRPGSRWLGAAMRARQLTREASCGRASMGEYLAAAMWMKENKGEKGWRRRVRNKQILHKFPVLSEVAANSLSEFLLAFQFCRGLSCGILRRSERLRWTLVLPGWVLSRVAWEFWTRGDHETIHVANVFDRTCVGWRAADHRMSHHVVVSTVTGAYLLLLPASIPSKGVIILDRRPGTKEQVLEEENSRKYLRSYLLVNPPFSPEMKHDARKNAVVRYLGEAPRLADAEQRATDLFWLVKLQDKTKPGWRDAICSMCLKEKGTNIVLTCGCHSAFHLAAAEVDVHAAVHTIMALGQGARQICELSDLQEGVQAGEHLVDDYIRGRKSGTEAPLP